MENKQSEPFCHVKILLSIVTDIQMSILSVEVSNQFGSETIDNKILTWQKGPDCLFPIQETI